MNETKTLNNAHGRRHCERTEDVDQCARTEYPDRRERRRDRQQPHLAQQVTGGGVDQSDGVGVRLDLVAVPVRPRGDGHAAHRMPDDDGTLARRERGIEHRVDIGCEVAQAITPAAGNPAASMAASIERDHPVFGGQIGDLITPHPDGAGDAVRQHDRVSILWPEYPGVQSGSVRGADGHGAARRQFRW
jgi:hypothetical protein